jgi:hypothetical protein
LGEQRTCSGDAATSAFDPKDLGTNQTGFSKENRQF